MNNKLGLAATGRSRLLTAMDMPTGEQTPVANRSWLLPKTLKFLNIKLRMDKQACRSTERSRRSPCHPLRFISQVVALLAVILVPLCLTSCSKSPREMAEKLIEKETSEGKSAYNTTQKEIHSDLLELDKHAQEMAGIKTIEIKRENISKIIEFPAELDFDRTKLISINSPIDGKVVKVSCNQGDMIKQGNTLAEIENPQTVGQIFKVNTQFNGFVTRRNINPMVWVTRGSTLFEVVDTSKLWGIIHLYPEESPEIKIGQKVRFVVSDSSQSLAGEINYISPSIDPDTRTIEARAVVDNPGNIPAHTYAVAQVTTDEKIKVLVVPEKAVFPEDFGKIVFTMDKNTFKKRTIETGIKRDGKVEVQQGLEEGDLLVIEGAYQIKNLTFKSKGGGEEEE